MVGRRARRVCRAGNGDAAVGLFQRGSVVHAVAGHADDVAALLQHVDDVELVLGEYLGEAVGLFDGLCHCADLASSCRPIAGIEDVRAHTQLFATSPGRWRIDLP